MSEVNLVVLARTVADELEDVRTRFAKLCRLDSAERLRVKLRHTVIGPDIGLADPIALEGTTKEAAYTSAVWRGECTKLGYPVTEDVLDIFHLRFRSVS